jgi:hypothetical protein
VAAKEMTRQVQEAYDRLRQAFANRTPDGNLAIHDLRHAN